jgi:Arc/MetJ-type ribon-helix-helix transcriptional regulator
MTVTLSPRAKELLEKTMQEGDYTSPEELLEDALLVLSRSRRRPDAEKANRENGSSSIEGDASIDEFRRALDALARGSEKLPRLPTSAFSRESIYRDRD